MVKSGSLEPSDEAFGPCDGQALGDDRYPDTFTGRLQAMAKFYGWSMRSMGDQCGLSESHIQGIVVSGSCSVKTLLKLHARTNVNLQWLILGKGEHELRMTKEDEANAIAARLRRGRQGATKADAPDKRTPKRASRRNGNGSY